MAGVNRLTVASGTHELLLVVTWKGNNTMRAKVQSTERQLLSHHPQGVSPAYCPSYVQVAQSAVRKSEWEYTIAGHLYTFFFSA